MILSNSVFPKADDLFSLADSLIILVITAAYIVGAVIVRARYDLGLYKPREQ